MQIDIFFLNVSLYVKGETILHPLKGDVIFLKVPIHFPNWCVFKITNTKVELQ